MTLLIVFFLALAWLGWAWAWSRERFVATASVTGVPPVLGVPRSRGSLAAPRTAAMARRRRRQVLATLGLVAVTTFVLARAWSPLWGIHLAVDGALVAYGVAVLRVERPDLELRWPGPVLEDAAAFDDPVDATHG